MKIFTFKEIFPLFFIMWAVIIGVAVFMAPCIPDQLPTHWNAQGQIDGYSSKPVAVFLLMGVLLAMYVLMLVLPRLDPFRKNYEHFEKQYYVLRLALTIFFVALYIFTLLAAAGYEVDIRNFMIPGFSLLFIVIGFMIPKMKRNYFVGIKTPWTLQSEEVWNKTHKMAGKCFIAAGILCFFTLWVGNWAFGIFMAIILLAALAPVVYSYLLYRKLGLFKK
ncbi:MAG: SdpI family protein [Candidatus Pacebacteria bacterium]|nr:SdpI family protein [Candidatus Paceibacterota bacterium]